MNLVEKQLYHAPPRNNRYILLISAVLVVLFAWSITAVNIENLEQSGISIAGSILKGIISQILICY